MEFALLLPPFFCECVYFLNYFFVAVENNFAHSCIAFYKGKDGPKWSTMTSLA